MEEARAKPGKESVDALAASVFKESAEHFLPIIHGRKIMSTTGIVFNIQHMTVHDGPGIRTEVFLKGCPMHCRWCSNPESIDPRRELGIYPSKCIGKDKCGLCLKACPKGGSPLVFTEDGIVIGSNEQCLRCMSCANACLTHAIKAWGDVMTVEQVMKEILDDRIYYESSGGGMTLNGGEVTVQWEFALELLKACKAEGISTCVESALLCKPEILEKFVPLTDIFYADIKNMDSEAHAYWSGAGNEQILENIRYLSGTGIPYVLRIPVVPQVNNTEENIRKTAEFILTLQTLPVQIQLLPYKKMGTEKYASLGRPYPMGEDYMMLPRAEWEANLKELADIMRGYGLPAVEGSNHIVNYKTRMC